MQHVVLASEFRGKRDRAEHAVDPDVPYVARGKTVSEDVGPARLAMHGLRGNLTTLEHLNLREHRVHPVAGSDIVARRIGNSAADGAARVGDANRCGSQIE